jgi:hypothetical protein
MLEGIIWFLLAWVKFQCFFANQNRRIDVKKKYLPLIASVAIWGCSGSPTTPTATRQTINTPSPPVPTQALTVAQTADPSPTPVPQGTGKEITLRNGVQVRIAGPAIPNPPCIHLDRKNLQTLRWDVSVLNASAIPFHLEVASFSDSKPGCDPTLDHPSGAFKSYGPGDFPSSRGNNVLLQFEPSNSMECVGRFQIDSVAVVGTTRDHIVTAIIDLGVVPATCATPTAPASTPAVPPAPTSLVEGHSFGYCDIQPDEVEIRIHNLGTAPISIKGQIFARPIGGAPVLISEVPPQYQIVGPNQWGGPEQRIRDVPQFKNPYFFDGTVYGSATAYTLEGAQIGQPFVLQETRLTCGNR